MSQGIEITPSRSSRGTSRQHRGLPARALLGGVCLVTSALLTVSYAQQAAPSGEEVYVDRLGCWNCHGKAGGGGAGAVIAKTRLPLRRFVSYVRLPSKEMPPYAPLLASDAELAIVYHWLDGGDAVRTPPAMTIDLKSPTGVRADGQARADVEVEVTARMADTASPSDMPAPASLGYRVTLITSANTPVVNQTVEYQSAGREDWSKFTTDEHGEALLGQDRGFVVIDAKEPDKTRTRLRTALAAGKTVLVVEALDDSAPANPVMVGIGSAILKVD